MPLFGIRFPEWGISEAINSAWNPNSQEKRDAYKEAISRSGLFGGASQASTQSQEENQSQNNNGGNPPPTTSPGPAPRNNGGGGSSGSSSRNSSRGSASNVADAMLRNDPSRSIIERQEAQRAAEAERLRVMQENYNNRYGQLGEMIRGRLAGAEQSRTSNMESINAELTNLLAKADASRNDTRAYFEDQRDTIQTNHTNAEKEMARVFGSRNIQDSSYYVEKMQEGDQAFEKTLAKMGTAEASQYSKLDADLTLYSQQAMSKKAEIEKAYTDMVTAINQDMTRNDWAKEDALQKLESEFNEKMSTIDDRIMTAQTQQQQFRNEVMKWSYDTSYKEAQDAQAYELESKKFNASLQKEQSGDTIYDALSQSQGEDGKVDPDVYARLRSSAKISAEQFDKKYGFMLSGGEQGNLGVKTATKTSSALEQEIWQDLSSPEATDMTDEEKAQYIQSRGGNPADFGIYP